MNAVILFFIAICASTIGAITGIGGGVLVKPIVDILDVLPVSAASFLSGCMVLSMALVSLLRRRAGGSKTDLKGMTPLAVGAACGGILGNLLFNTIKGAVNRDDLVVFFQSFVLLLLVVGVFVYIQMKHRIKTLKVVNSAARYLVGLILGCFSSFLGIGGGPINLVVLYFLFSMDEKTAAISSLYVIVFSQTASLLFAFITQNVPQFNPLNLVVMVVGGIAGGMIGSSVLKRISGRGVSLVFQLFLIAIIIICGLNMIRSL